MAMPLAPLNLVRAAVARGAALGHQPASVARAIQRAGFSTRGLGVRQQVRDSVEALSQARRLEGAHGNFVPRLGRGASEARSAQMARYRAVARVETRTQTGERSTTTVSVLSDQPLTVAQYRRAAMQQVQQTALAGLRTSSAPVPVERVLGAEITAVTVARL